jgi:hypothetical protein
LSLRDQPEPIAIAEAAVDQADVKAAMRHQLQRCRAGGNLGTSYAVESNIVQQNLDEKPVVRIVVDQQNRESTH